MVSEPLVDVKYLVMTRTFTLYPGIKWLTDIPTLIGCAEPTDHIRLCYVNPLTEVYGIPEYSPDSDVTIYPVPVSMMAPLGTWDNTQRFDIPTDVVKNCQNNRTIIVFDGSGESTDILGSVTSGRVSDFLESCGLEDHTYNTIVNTCVFYDLPPQNVIVTTGHDCSNRTDPNFMWCNMNMVEAVLNPGRSEHIRHRQYLINNRKPKRRILSYNGRARGHKVILMQGLYHRNIVQDNLISCDGIQGSGALKVMSDLSMPWRQTQISDAQPPMHRNDVTTNKLTQSEAWNTHYNYYYHSQTLSEQLESAVCLSTETWGHDVPLALGRFHHVSEKTYRPIVSAMPFVSWSQNFTLERLHSQGYETFSEFWSEDYDVCSDPDIKTQKVLDIVTDICDMTDSDCQDLLIKSWRQCEHNYHNYLDRWHSQAHSKNLTDMLQTWECV